MIAALKSQLEGMFSFFYPEVCQICGGQRATQAEGYVCAQCWQTVRFIVPPYCDCCGLPYEGEITTQFECSNCRELEFDFQWARAAVASQGVVREAIHRFKYQRALWFEPFLADLLIRQAVPMLREGGWDMIAPVPLHPVKEREREFNQSERIAHHLGKALELPVRTDLLRRIEPTLAQAKLSRKDRADNVRKAFAASENARVDGARVIVIDDVLTTGATTSACAKVLRDIGAGDVCVWTVARGL